MRWYGFSPCAASTAGPFAGAADLIEVHRKGWHVFVECSRHALVGFRYPRGIGAQGCRAAPAVAESARDRADIDPGGDQLGGGVVAQVHRERCGGEPLLAVEGVYGDCASLRAAVPRRRAG